MSPEQAAGRLAELGPASDVYSLGATLYCLLTGRPPFQGRDHGVLLQQVQKGVFPPPRQVKPGVPAALEAVCLRALALRPTERYATPRELADEVERWLADEPVRAYRESVVQRLRRWGRRHRTVVASAAVLLVTAVLGLAVGLVAVNAERQRTEAARDASRAGHGTFREIVRDLAEVHLAQGEHAQASVAAGQLAEHAYEPAKDRYKAACVLADCVPLAAKDGKLPEARRQELAKEYADRALAALRQAVTDGYRDSAQVRKETALDPLRGRDDFKKLLADLEKVPAAPKPPAHPGP
jgi:hypothetical protein